MYKIFLLTLYFSIVSSFADFDCNDLFRTVVNSKEEVYKLFLSDHKKLVAKLLKEKELHFKDLKNPENVIFAINKENGTSSFLLESNDKLFVFDRSLPKGYEIAEGNQFGFKMKLNLGERYQVVSNEYLLKTTEKVVVLLPKEEFADNAVKEYLKATKSENKELIQKYADEIQYLISNLHKDPEGEISGLSVLDLDEAEFHNVKLVKNASLERARLARGSSESLNNGRLASESTDEFTFMFVNGKTYFLTKDGPYDWMGSSQKSGIFSPLQIGYLAENKVLEFVTDSGKKMFFSLNNGDFIDQGNTLDGLFEVLRRGNERAAVSFRELFSEDLLELVIRHEIHEIKATRLLAVTGKEDAYVLMLNNQAFYFEKGGIDFLNLETQWSEIAKAGIGFTHPKARDIILENRFVLKITKEQVLFQDLVEKSPLFLDEISENPLVPQVMKNIIRVFKPEFETLLEETHLTKSLFAHSTFQVVTDTKTGKKVVYMDSQNLHVFFSPELIPGDPLFSKTRYHIVNKETGIGFESFEKRVFLVENQAEIELHAKGLNIRPLDLKKFAKEKIDLLTSQESKLAPFYKTMIGYHRDQLEKLIVAKKLTLQDLLPPNSSFAISAKRDESYWAIPIEGDVLLFKTNRPGKYKSLIAVGKRYPGFRVLQETGVAKVAKRPLGLGLSANAMTIVEESLSNDHAIEVLISKASLILNKKLNAIEKDAVLKAFVLGTAEVGLDGKTAGRVGNFTPDQIKAKVRFLRDTGLFSDEQIFDLFTQFVL